HATALVLSGDTADHDLVAPDAATLQSRSTVSLYRLCESRSRLRSGLVPIQLMGLADLLLAMGNSQMPGGICGADYDAATLSKVFSFWAEHHPERWKDDMAVSAQASFRELWPCQRPRIAVAAHSVMMLDAPKSAAVTRA
ncbi:MAG: hypothetical protein JO289_14415, partial [Xanthobacteraceae bacterium]|nr:hypothetical protein [Xanthobacteraceae bacterium]